MKIGSGKRDMDGGNAQRGAALRSAAVRGLAALALLLLAGSAVAATSLSIVPDRIELSAANPSTVLTLHNDGADTLVVNLQAQALTPDAIIDHFAATGDIDTTPSLIALAPGATQTVTVELRAGAAASEEVTYRLAWTGFVARPAPQS